MTATIASDSPLVHPDQSNPLAADSLADTADRSGRDLAASTGPSLGADDLQYCRHSLNNGSRSFLAASYLLPAQVRYAATALYAFCREADDLVDLGDDPSRALAEVRLRVDRVYGDGALDSAADRALRCVVRHYHLPQTLLNALIEGFEWDVTDRQYQTITEVEDYAARVAGTVGALMSLLMGAREPSVVARACDLGVAMQLTNICRDVGEDARAGRCYLPLEWLQEVGVAPDAILDRQSQQGISQVVYRMLSRASELYHRADSGLAMLPGNCQRGIRMARHLYASIGDEIARLNYENLHTRAFVTGRRKCALLVKHWPAGPACRHEVLQLPALPSTQWLVDAVKQSPVDAPVDIYHGLLQSGGSTSDELVTVLRIIDRLENVKRTQLQAGTGKVPLGFAGVVR